MSVELVVVAIGFIATSLFLFFHFRRVPLKTLPISDDSLRKIPLFRHLSPGDLTRVKRLVKETHLKNKEYLIHENDQGTALYYVISGRIDVLKRGAVDNILVNSVAPGEFIGEMAILTGTRRVASAIAVEPSHLLVIESEAFQNLLESVPRLKEEVWNTCDIHSIDLVLRDHEKLRQLSRDSRHAWITARKSVTVDSESVIVPEGIKYVAIVKDSIIHKNTTYISPDLVEVETGQTLKTNVGARLSWLGDPATDGTSQSPQAA